MSETPLTSSLLTPMLALIVWSLVMLVWTYATRIPALGRAGVDPANAREPRALDALPISVRQVGYNYNHLMEQPTIFYPTVIMLAVMGPGALDVAMAWAYVFIRIVHSIWQATVNVVAIRFALFILATSCLAALAVRAVLATLLHDPSVVTG